MQKMVLSETENGLFQAIGVAPRVDREGVQRTDKDGTPQWTVETLRRPADGSPAEVIAVRVAAAKEPHLTPMCDVIFRGLTAFYWSMETRSGISLSADEVVPASAGHSRGEKAGE